MKVVQFFLLPALIYATTTVGTYKDNDHDDDNDNDQDSFSSRIDSRGLGFGGCTTHSQCGSGQYCYSCAKCLRTPGCTVSNVCRYRPTAGDCAPVANCYRDNDPIDGHCPGRNPNHPCNPNPCKNGQRCVEDQIQCFTTPCYNTYHCVGWSVGGGYHHCGTNEEWVSCGSPNCWENTCANSISPWPPRYGCSTNCKSGCRCKSGYKRGYNGVCTKTCYVLGRPYSTKEGYLLAPVTTPSITIEAEQAAVHVNCSDDFSGLALAHEQLAQAAQYWAHSAAMEHASVASFSRFSLDLMSVGAPTELLSLTHQAALDEVRHTQVALKLANEFGNASFVPGALPLSEKVAEFAFGNMEKIATSAAREGCIEETLAASVAAYQAEHMGDPQHQAELRSVAADEATHAALAWRAVKWMTRTPEIHKAVSAVFSEQAVLFAHAPTTAAEPTLQHLGLLDEGTMEKLHYTAWHEVVAPAAASLGFLPKVHSGSGPVVDVIARALA